MAFKFIFYILFVFLLSCQKSEEHKATDQAKDQEINISGPIMGTQYHVKLIQSDSNLRSKSQADWQEIIHQELERINQLMSTYIADSELSLFNQFKQKTWYKVHWDTAWVAQEALKIANLTQGAFDPTLGPIVNLWGFGPKGERNKIPNSKKLKELMLTTGFHKLQVRLDPPALKKSHPNLYLDLSGIAKGYAVDRVAEIVEKNQINRYMVEVGGEVRVSGKNKLGEFWKIGIEKPSVGKRSILKVVTIKNLAMATSGSYRNYFERDGTRFSHMIDPRTGRPIEHRLVAVTIFNDRCMTADALATALMILGLERGYQLAEKENWPVLFLEKTSQGVLSKSSTAFKKKFGSI